MRASAIEQAAAAASDAALSTLEIGNRVLRIVDAIEPSISANIKADITAGTKLVQAMNAVATENVKANISGIKNDQLREQILGRLERA